MKWNILHESRGRIRLHLRKPRMSLAEADQLQDYLTGLPGVRTAAVYERTCDVVIVYTESRAGIVRGLAAFRFDTEALAEVPANSPRAVNREYQEKLVNMTIFHFARKLFLPAPLRMVYTLVRSAPYIFRGLRCVFRRRLEVEVLDALSIGVSMLRGDFGTAGSVMFLLRLGELLEEWTRKKSLGDLARCMSLNVDRVWQQTAEGEVLVPISQVCAGDAIVVHTGSVIPLDGRVLDGEASVNQASLTGEAEPVRKSEGAVVYAGTVVEEGEVQAIFSHPTSKAARRLVYPAGAPQAEVLPGHKLVRVAFGGTQTTDKPLVASLAIECGALVSIMAADTRIVNGQTLGSMLLALPDDDKAAAALEYIRNYPGITFEEVNG